MKNPEIKLSENLTSNLLDWNENPAEVHLNNLHHLMMFWLDSEEYRESRGDWELRHTYNVLRDFLIELKHYESTKEEVEESNLQFQKDQEHRKKILAKQREASDQILKDAGGFFALKI